MKIRSKRTILPIAAAILLFAGVYSPISTLAQIGASAGTEAQLQTLVQTAQSSHEYASTLVSTASLHGLPTSTFQSQIASGDTFLSTAIADLDVNSNIQAGIIAAKAAMNEYTRASAGASLALQGAGFTSSVDLALVEGAIAEVNATAEAVASVAAQACSSTSVSGPNATVFNQACASVSAHISNATVSLTRAAAVIAQIEAGASVSASIPTATHFVIQGRGNVSLASLALRTVAAFGYAQRGTAFIQGALAQLYAQANQTVQVEEDIASSFSTFNATYSASAAATSSAASNTSSAISSLSSAISGVDTGSVTTSIQAAQDTAEAVESNLSALATLVSGLPGSASLVSAITSAQSATTSYTTAIAAASAQNGAFATAQIASFSSYLDAVRTGKGAVASTAQEYVSDYQSVVADLSSLLVLFPSLQSTFQAMSALSVSVSSTTASVNTSLEAEVAEMTNVGAGISDLSTALDTVQPTPSLNPITSSSFNATTWSTIVEAAQAVQSASIDTSSFVTSVQTALSGSVSYFSSEEGSLTTNGTRLRTQLAATAGVVADAAAALNTELATRQSEISSARIYMTQALSLFTDLDISGGASAMLQATVELKAASAISASV